MEKFIEVKGTNGKYLISDQGNLKSLCRNKPVIVKPFTDKDGYLKYGISRKNKFIHRLVALAFIPNPENKPEVNHKDGNKQNNCVSNLQWATRSENQQHAFDNGLQVAVKGEKQWCSKLKKSDVIFIKQNKGLITYQKMADMFDVGTSTISNIINKKEWKHITI